ncbi:MAG: hypothetical protein HQ557_08800 [Bacteroidetes bacterium]|nr:hypothetical protein [Bacteroidota bacterium]
MITKNLKEYVEIFCKNDTESVINSIPNKKSYTWLSDNIPLFDCPNEKIVETYYFRWWVYRKHIKQTDDGYIVTELLPDVAHSSKHNAVSLAAPQHILEGRWLKNKKIIKDYIKFWYEDTSRIHYNVWLCTAVNEYVDVTLDYDFVNELLPKMKTFYLYLEKIHRHKSGLFWCKDDPDDGGEYSISGNGLRPSINAIMFGEAYSISMLSLKVGDNASAKLFKEKAMKIKELTERYLWDHHDNFFKNIPLLSIVDEVAQWDFTKMNQNKIVKEIYGFMPWLFSLPDSSKNIAWKELFDSKGFYAPFGPTSAEQRHPLFMKNRIKRCQWDGSSWPFATSLVLSAMAKMLREYNNPAVKNEDFYDMLCIYTNSHKRILPYGEMIPWIGESLHPQSGIWLSRAIALEGKDSTIQDLNEAVVRGKDYNHSMYCNIIIRDLLGISFSGNKGIIANPIIPKDWDWFCLENLYVGNDKYTIMFDRKGDHFNRGKGLKILKNIN